MMLKNISLTNYRIFKKETRLDFTDLPMAMIFGPESQGKTSLIAGIHWLVALSLGKQTLSNTLSLSLLGQPSEIRLSCEFLFGDTLLAYSLFYNPVTRKTRESLTKDQQSVFYREEGAVDWAHGEVPDLPGDKTLLSTIFEDSGLTQTLGLSPLRQYLLQSVYIEPLKEKIYAQDKIRLKLQDLNGFFDAHQIPLRASLGDAIRGNHIQMKLSTKKKILLITHLKEGRTLPLTEESLDIRTLVNLLPALFRLREAPGILLMDNLSKALHPKTEALLIAWIKRELKDTTTLFVSLSEHTKKELPSELLRPSSPATIKH